MDTYFWIAMICVAVGLILLIVSLVMHFKSSKAEHFSNSTVVYVYSSTCPHCQTFGPVFDKYMSEHPNVAHKKILGSSPEAKAFDKQVSGYPTTLVVDSNNHVVAQLVGSVRYEVLAQFVTKNVQ